MVRWKVAVVVAELYTQDRHDATAWVQTLLLVPSRPHGATVRVPCSRVTALRLRTKPIAVLSAKDTTFGEEHSSPFKFVC